MKPTTEGISPVGIENIDGDQINPATEESLVQLLSSQITSEESLLMIANLIAQIAATRGVAADLRVTVLSGGTIAAVTTLSNQTSIGGWTASTMVQNSQNNVAVQSNINNIASN